MTIHVCLSDSESRGEEGDREGTTVDFEGTIVDFVYWIIHRRSERQSSLTKAKLVHVV